MIGELQFRSPWYDGRWGVTKAGARKCGEECSFEIKRRKRSRSGMGKKFKDGGDKKRESPNQPGFI